MGRCSSSAIIRRWICSSGVLSSRRISLYFRESDANRMMSTATICSSEPPSAPCLMLPPAIDGSGNIAYRFHSLVKKEDFTHTSTIDEVQLPVDINLINDVVFVGSSHGWLALYNRRNCDLILSNPIADRHIKLPPLHTLGAADRLILSSSLSSDEREEEDGRLAFMTFGSRRRMAFCSPGRSNEWTLFGGEDHGDKFDSLACDNLSYSRKHKRLFCISEEDYFQNLSRLESWVVHQDKPPTLEWIYGHTEEINLNLDIWRPLRSEFQQECLQMRYLVTAEHSGEVFMVVRHVNLRAGPFGSLVDKVFLSSLRGCHYIRTPYKTIDFDVYKIDPYPERVEVVYKYNSLGGLAMFVGVNDSFAIPAAGVAGLKPDCIYFTDENRVVEPTRLERASYGGHDNGIFDYRTRDFYPCCDLYPIEFEKIRKILPLPLWFTPI